MKKILALLLAMLLVLSVFASCGTNDGEETEDTEKKTEATGDSEKETEKETEKESEKESDGGSDAETPACQHPDADKSYTSVDATNHKVTCKCGATVAATEAHSYDNDADMKCNKCNYDRTPAAPACTHPEADKTYTKIDATNHKVTCKCGATVAATEAHTFASETTAKCSKCDYTRCVNHVDANSDFICDTADCNVVVEPAAGELTLAQAKALGALMGSKLTTNKYILSGTITKVEKADSYGNITITDGTDEILIYGTYDATGATRYGNMTEKPAKGDTMVVSGVLTSYNGVGQMKDGWITSYQIHTHTFVEGTCTACGASEIPCLHENSATVISATKHYVNCECEVKQIADHDFGTDTVCDACGFDSSYTYAAPVEGTAYYFGMVQGAVSLDDVYYLTGAESGFYMATSKDEADATKIYVEATAGGYYLYCYVDTVKTYINMVASGTYVNGKYQAEATTVYTFDNVTNTFIANVNSNDYRFGTKNDGTFTTVGPVKVENNAFFCQLYVAEAAPTCDHAEAEYVNNGDGTHTLTCDCEATFDPEAHNYINGVCDKCHAECTHSKDYTNNGADHSWTCDICDVSAENEAHNYVSGTCACGAVCTHESKTCTNNGNGETHAWECACGLSGTEDHIYDDNDDMICNACEFDRTPTGTCTHDEYNYVNNNNGTHTATCADNECDNETGRTFTEAHNYVNGVCDKCEAECTHDNSTYDNNNDGTHTQDCACGATFEAEDHTYVNGVCDKCEAECAHSKDYTNNGADHSWTCDICDVSAENEEHFFDGGTCVCEATCAHESKSYTANGANHTWTCDAENCTATGSESHTDATGNDYKCDKCEAVVEPDTNTLTIVEANKLGDLYAKNNYTTKKYSVTGVVKEVVVSNGYGNVTITDGNGNDLYIYGLYGDENYTVKYPNMNPKPIVGDTITVYGVIGKYNSVQMNKGWATDIQHDHDYTDNKCACGAYSDDDAGKAQEALDTIVSGIKATYNENLVIDFSDYLDGYTWTINTDPVEEPTFVIDQHETDKKEHDLTIRVTVGEKYAEKTVHVVINPSNPTEDGEETILATFEFGENKPTTDGTDHTDGSEKTAEQLSTLYGLTFTSATKVYANAYDEMGNSCLKLGTGSLGASFTFTVGEDVKQVVIKVAKYKKLSNAGTIYINDVEQSAITSASNDGNYDEIIVDTSVDKTITVSTTNSAPRVMINTIIFMG